MADVLTSPAVGDAAIPMAAIDDPRRGTGSTLTADRLAFDALIGGPALGPAAVGLDAFLALNPTTADSYERLRQSWARAMARVADAHSEYGLALTLKAGAAFCAHPIDFSASFSNAVYSSIWTNFLWGPIHALWDGLVWVAQAVPVAASGMWALLEEGSRTVLDEFGWLRAELEQGHGAALMERLQQTVATMEAGLSSWKPPSINDGLRAAASVFESVADVIDATSTAILAPEIANQVMQMGSDPAVLGEAFGTIASLVAGFFVPGLDELVLLRIFGEEARGARLVKDAVSLVGSITGSSSQPADPLHEKVLQPQERMLQAIAAVSSAKQDFGRLIAIAESDTTIARKAGAAEAMARLVELFIARIKVELRASRCRRITAEGMAAARQTLSTLPALTRGDLKNAIDLAYFAADRSRGYLHLHSRTSRIARFANERIHWAANAEAVMNDLSPADLRAMLSANFQFRYAALLESAHLPLDARLIDGVKGVDVTGYAYYDELRRVVSNRGGMLAAPLYAGEHTASTARYLEKIESHMPSTSSTSAPARLTNLTTEMNRLLTFDPDKVVEGALLITPTTPLSKIYDHSLTVVKRFDNDLAAKLPPNFESYAKLVTSLSK